MNSIIIAFTFAALVPSAVLIITLIISIKSLSDREKLSPFECGFDPNHSSRIPFSLRFFLLAIIFIVFDIEIVLLIPIPIIINIITTHQLINTIIFLIILLLGLLHE